MKYIKPLILIAVLAVTSGDIAVGQNSSNTELADKYGNLRGMVLCLLMKKGIYEKNELDVELKSMIGDTEGIMLLILSREEGLIERSAVRSVAYQVENCFPEFDEYLMRNHQ